MKHIISLSLKYIRRQKLRTFLTFMCILLSAFILASVCTYGSSLYSTTYKMTLYESGSWELDVSPWIANAKNHDEAADIVMHHAVVSDYLFIRREDSRFSSGTPRQHYFELSDGRNTQTVKFLESIKLNGNRSLQSNDRSIYTPDMNMDLSADGVYVSKKLKDMGYSEGDSIDLTIRPVNAVIDESADTVKKARETLKEIYGTEYCYGEEGYNELSKEQKKKAYGGTIYSFIKLRMHIPESDMPYTDIHYGEPVTYSFRIAGFIPDTVYTSFNDDFIIFNTDNSDISISELNRRNPDKMDNADDPASIHINGGIYDEMKIRLIDNFDYDESVKMLFTDLGYNYDTDFYENNLQCNTNETLLALELKSPYAVYHIFSDIAIPALIVLLIAWFISRFVIDCTFEMAVQERSTHFAALRILGASKGQIATLVLIEALFYCLTAVPLGIAAAILLCRSSFISLERSGIEAVEFSAKPAFILIGAFLSVIAVFISAYTSAMWASRKLSPAEALNFGKPRSSKRRLRKRKSRLDLSAKKFIRRYTRKNIKSAKGRFVIATITMAMGVFMFTVSSLICVSFLNMIIKANKNNYDFYIFSYIPDSPDIGFSEADKYFADDEIFSKYKISGSSHVMLNNADGSEKTVREKLSLNPEINYYYVTLYAIDEDEYKDKGLDTITGMSYEQFKSLDGFLYNNSIYGDRMEYDYDEEAEIVFDRSYTDLGSGLTISDMEANTFKIVGIVTSPVADNHIIIPIEKAYENNISYDINLRAKDNQHYNEALERVSEFCNTALVGDYDNSYMEGTGLFTFIGAIMKIVLIFLISIWLVGILSMINSVNTSVLNRSRELMMLRSVGMTRQQLRRSIMLETLMFSATAAIAGTLLGAGTFILLMHNDLSWKKLCAVPVVVVFTLALNVCISLASALPAIRSLGRVEAIARASAE